MCFLCKSDTLNPNLISVFRSESSVPRYVNFCHENVNFLKLIFSCNECFSWCFWGHRIRICQYSLRIVPRIVFFLKLKNKDYKISSKHWGNPDKHALSNKMDVRFEVKTPKTHKSNLYDPKSIQNMFSIYFKKLTFS